MKMILFWGGATFLAVLSSLLLWTLWARPAPAHGSTPLPRIYSIRTEPGARGHTMTTIAFPVRSADGYIIECIVTEDQGPPGSTPAIALSQSCDFATPVG